MNSRNIALLFAFLAALIYGINYSVAKDVMPLFVKPYAFIVLRVSGFSSGSLVFLSKKKKLIVKII